DAAVREFDARVVGGDRFVVPVGDVAEEDAGDGVLGESEVVRRRGELIRRYHCPHGHRDVPDLRVGLGLLVFGHRTGRGAKVDGPVYCGADTTTRTDRLVVHADAAVHLVVFVHPGGVEDVGEGRTGAVERLARIGRA